MRKQREKERKQPQQQQQHEGSSKQDKQVVGKEVRDCGNSSKVVVKYGKKIGRDDSNDNCKSEGDTAPQRRIGSNSEEGIDTNISEIVAGSTQLELERLNAESHSSNDKQSEGCAKTIVDSTKPQTISDADGDIVPEAALYKLSTSPRCIGSRVLSVSHPEAWMNEMIAE